MKSGRKNLGLNGKSYGTSYREEDRHLIENYDLAKESNFKKYILIHRLEFDLEGNIVHTKESLKRLGMYYNRPHYELKYITMKEYAKLHPISYKDKKHLSKICSGENSYWYGKKLPLDIRAKISAKRRLNNLELDYLKSKSKKSADEYYDAFEIAYPELSKYLIR